LSKKKRLSSNYSNIQSKVRKFLKGEIASTSARNDSVILFAAGAHSDVISRAVPVISTFVKLVAPSF
jgi:hypothetical protein